jgi:hypothetical protein
MNWRDFAEIPVLGILQKSRPIGNRTLLVSEFGIL